ncbi:MAG: hypothetical protein HY070_02325 [Chloroflexi bacterium]|nr:hypothetical protein [Chloroflexota bacterium]MBI3741014.1 hypothetical protein [Chloroflexota bacterium]
MITRNTVLEKILGYLNHELSRAQLVDWAEEAMHEGEFDPRESLLLSEIVARIGAADVEDFALTWEDLDSILARLGFTAKVLVA